MRDFIANQVEIQWSRWALARDGEMDVGSLGAFQHVGHCSGVETVGRFAVNGDNDVAGAEAGFE